MTANLLFYFQKVKCQAVEKAHFSQQLLKLLNYHTKVTIAVTSRTNDPPPQTIISSLEIPCLTTGKMLALLSIMCHLKSNYHISDYNGHNNIKS